MASAMNALGIPDTVIDAMGEGFSLMKAYRQHLGLPIQFVAAKTGIAVHRLVVLESGTTATDVEIDAIGKALKLPEGFLTN